jgi:hypothetical protein
MTGVIILSGDRVKGCQRIAKYDVRCGELMTSFLILSDEAQSSVIIDDTCRVCHYTWVKDLQVCRGS